jgi:16S rRNA (adenine(1408)-N(1))-methyltransferase
MGAEQLSKRISGCERVVLDLGTGDGRYVHNIAERHPNWFVVGVDACRENLREHSRAGLPNALFIIAAAQELPHELHGLVSRVTINFPWGSLLSALLEGDAALMNGLASLASECLSVEVRLNGGALAEAGRALDEGAERVRLSLLEAGWRSGAAHIMEAAELQALPSTWARRLAHGRDPRALLISGSLANGARRA